MKINWVAPLPPAKTGVALYCRDLLPRLTEWADVRCWTPQKVWDREIESRVRVATLENNEAFWRELNRADLTICHLGNNPFAFGEIQEIASRHPSLVVLHEPQLFELFLGIACDIRRDPTLFQRQLHAVYGRAADHAMLAMRTGACGIGELAGRFPLTEAAIAGALGVFCHHPRAAAQVSATGWRRPLAWHGLPASGPPPSASRSRPKGGRVRLIAFGHFPKEHELGPLLDALAAYPRRQRLHLDVFGEIPGFAELADRRDRLALQGEVLFHGFVIESTLSARLAEADLTLDLRRPTGAASAVRLESWRFGVPCTELVDEGTEETPAIRPVKASRFREDLHAAWDDLLDRPASYRPLIEAGNEALDRDHRPESYLEQLLAFAETCQAGYEDAARQRLERRLAELQLLT